MSEAGRKPAPPSYAWTSPVPLLVSGLTTLAIWIAMSRLSSQFIWGENRLDRPIRMIVALYMAASIVYLIAWVRVTRSTPRRWHGAFIVIIGAASRLVFIDSNMIQESDAYRYLWDGAIMRAGISPYRYPPAEFLAGNRGSAHEQADPEIDRFRESMASDARAGTVLHRISYPHVVTIYPPLAQLFFWLGAVILPWRLLGLRLIFLTFDLAAMITLAALLRDRGRWQAHAGLLLYAWSPLVIKEVANSVHYDGLVAWMIIGAIGPLALRCVAAAGKTGGSLTEQPRTPISPATLIISSLCLGAAVATRLWPALLIPLVAAYHWRSSPRNAVRFLVITLLVVASAYLPFYLQGSAPTGSLWQFIAEWERNASIHPLITWFVEHTGFTWHTGILPAEWQPRADSILASVLLAGVLLLVTLYMTRQTARAADPGRSLIDHAVALPVLAFCFSPVQNPWYLVGLVPLLALQPRPYLSVVCLTGLLGLHYLSFHYEYRDQESAFLVVRCVEFIPFYLLVLLEGLARSLGPDRIRTSRAPAEAT